MVATATKRHPTTCTVVRRLIGTGLMSLDSIARVGSKGASAGLLGSVTLARINIAFHVGVDGHVGSGSRRYRFIPLFITEHKNIIVLFIRRTGGEIIYQGVSANGGNKPFIQQGISDGGT